MAGRSQEKGARGFQRDRERGAEYYLGFLKEGFGEQEEANVPYKLEPSDTEIENFLTRLRQEGL